MEEGGVKKPGNGDPAFLFERPGLACIKKNKHGVQHNKIKCKQKITYKATGKATYTFTAVNLQESSGHSGVVVFSGLKSGFQNSDWNHCTPCNTSCSHT